MKEKVAPATLASSFPNKKGAGINRRQEAREMRV
jgi:hypothetical protein